MAGLRLINLLWIYSEVISKNRSKALEESTHHDLGPAGVAAVKAESHHVGLAVHVPFAALV